LVKSKDKSVKLNGPVKNFVPFTFNFRLLNFMEEVAVKNVSILMALLFSFTVSCSSVFLPSIFSDPVFVGSKQNGFKQCRDCTVSPEKAYELAEPFLERTHELRNAVRNFPSHRLNMDDYILLKGRYYYIARDNYPYKTWWAYFNHAVRVNCMTGEVKEPE